MISSTKNKKWILIPLHPLKKIHFLKNGITFLGSAEESNIHLKQTSDLNHCEILLTNNYPKLRSTSNLPTFINNQKIDSYMIQELHHNDILVFGIDITKLNTIEEEIWTQFDIFQIQNITKLPVIAEIDLT